MKKVYSKAKTKRELKKFYTSLIPTIRQVARRSGYAIGVHGSLTRDLDLIAVPWIDSPLKPETLVLRIEKAVCKHVFIRTRNTVRKIATVKPNGRVAYVIMVGVQAYIDLSVCPHTPCV